MEEAIQTVVKVFLKSGKGKESLGPKDFQNMVKSQLSNILSDADSKEAVQNMGKGLDENKDGKVGFDEYMKLVGYLAQSLSKQRCRANEAQPAQNAQNSAAENAAPKAETREDKMEASADGKVEEEKKEKEVEVEVEKPAEVTSPGVDVTAPTVEVTSSTVGVAVEEENAEAEETEKVVEDAAEKMADAAAEEEEAEKKPDESATS
ncbi:S100 calcium binding protein U [Syngnathoides biaculeatus]|uniref:S100 calcium binding protein U n=1 Tax=Syngnathoides biaculeatus TaxID=300417 RepID=UPI002ADD7867|nr:S100 calcium binding protein U [Syngnathoides biaculeatus]XP_061674055.1 S100 calcium binding protein U [Syngnathoides biaculeatus]